jgi:L-iditol 2-dehydrogenase
MRAVVLDATGLPALAELPEPDGAGERIRVLACGLCGSDVEKLGRTPAGSVLGHEVVGQSGDGRRVALVHHLPCGECDRCRAGHETTCARFAAATIRPGGFAAVVRADETVDVPEGIGDAVATYVEPLACVLRAVERLRQGRILVVGTGFVGRLFLTVLQRRGDTVYAIDRDPDRRVAPEPDGPVDSAVLCARGGAEAALAALEPGGTLAVFASAGALNTDAVYRRELTVLGIRSATPRHMREAAALLAGLDVPEPTVLPLERFTDGLELYRRRQALKVVFTP